MYELEKFGKVFASKFVGTGPSSYKKKNLPGRGLTMVEKHCFSWPKHGAFLTFKNKCILMYFNIEISILD